MSFCFDLQLFCCLLKVCAVSIFSTVYHQSPLTPFYWIHFFQKRSTERLYSMSHSSCILCQLSVAFAWCQRRTFPALTVVSGLMTYRVTRRMLMKFIRAVVWQLRQSGEGIQREGGGTREAVPIWRG